MKMRMGVLGAMWIAIVVFSVLEGGVLGLAEAIAKASFWCLVFNRLWVMVAPSDETVRIPMAPMPKPSSLFAGEPALSRLYSGETASAALFFSAINFMSHRSSL